MSPARVMRFLPQPRKIESWTGVFFLKETTRRTHSCLAAICTVHASCHIKIDHVFINRAAVCIKTTEIFKAVTKPLSLILLCLQVQTILTSGPYFKKDYSGLRLKLLLSEKLTFCKEWARQEHGGMSFKS